MVNAFVFSLDIPVLINILYEMIKILHEKILNAIYLYWFHNDTLAENNSLNGHSNEPWREESLKINEERSVTSPVKQNHLGIFYQVKELISCK